LAIRQLHTFGKLLSDIKGLKCGNYYTFPLAGEVISLIQHNQDLGVHIFSRAK